MKCIICNQLLSLEECTLAIFFPKFLHLQHLSKLYHLYLLIINSVCHFFSITLPSSCIYFIDQQVDFIWLSSLILFGTFMPSLFSFQTKSSIISIIMWRPYSSHLTQLYFFLTLTGKLQYSLMPLSQTICSHCFIISTLCNFSD